jgi:hypothetical protein
VPRKDVSDEGGRLEVVPEYRITNWETSQTKGLISESRETTLTIPDNTMGGLRVLQRNGHEYMRVTPLDWKRTTTLVRWMYNTLRLSLFFLCACKK